MQNCCHNILVCDKLEFSLNLESALSFYFVMTHKECITSGTYSFQIQLQITKLSVLMVNCCQIPLHERKLRTPALAM